MIEKGNQARVSVVIATTAEKKREEQINNAIASVLSQTGCTFTLIVVINGNRFDPEVRQSIEGNDCIQSHYLPEGNFPKALMYARSIIEGKYFCFLDDDDELLPDSLQSRFDALESNKEADVAVGNGLKKHNETLELETHANILKYHEAPLAALFKQNGNWLASCAGMYRSATIPQEYFDDYAVFAEWTYIAFKLAIYKQVTFVNTLCYRINVQGESLSHNEQYLLGQYNMANKLLDLPLPVWARKNIFIKIRDMEHDLAERYLNNGQKAKAWLYHFKSLGNFKTFHKYVLFTRYLLSKSFLNNKN